MASLADIMIAAFQDIILQPQTINAQNTVLAGAATAGSVATVGTANKGQAVFQITANTLTVPLTPYGSVDGVNWVAMGGIPLVNQATGRQQGNIAAGVSGIFSIEVSDLEYIRLSTPNSATAGSATVVAAATAAVSSPSPTVPQYSAARVLGATATPKTGQGILHSLAIAQGATATAITPGDIVVYDNTAASGTVLWSANILAGDKPYSLILDLPFAVGLTIICPAGVQVAAAYV